MRFAVALGTFTVAISACVDPLTTKAVNTPEWSAKNVGGYADTVAGLPPETLFGWDLVVTSDAVRWRECAAVDACGKIERTRPAKDLIAVEHLGRTAVDGEQVDVVKLSLAARPKYVVPYSKPTSR